MKIKWGSGKKEKIKKKKNECLITVQVIRGITEKRKKEKEGKQSFSSIVTNLNLKKKIIYQTTIFIAISLMFKIHLKFLSSIVIKSYKKAFFSLAHLPEKKEKKNFLLFKNFIAQ